MPIHVMVRDLRAGAAAWPAALPEPLATIGRNDSCDLVLDDPDKHVSRLHATVALRDGAHYLTVNSKINPVMLDGAPCPPDTPCPLRDGACVTMYPFELTLTLAAGAAPARPAAAEPGGADPFSWLGEARPAPPAASADPFGLNYLQAGAGAPDIGSQPDPFKLAPVASPPGLVPGMFEPSSGHGLGPAVSLDPLQLLAGTGQPAAGPASPAGSIDDLFFGGGLRGNGAAGAALVDFGGPSRQGGSSALDHVHDFNLPFHTSQLQAPPPPAAPASAPASAPAPARSAAIDADFDWLDSLVPSKADPFADRGRQGGEAAPAAPIVAAAPPPAPAPYSYPLPPAVAAPAPATAHPLPPAGGAAAFLRGLGAAGLHIPPEQEAEFFEQAGEIVQAAVQGLVALLQARAEVKKEMRADERTLLASRANNPLKFMGSSGEALRFLFDPAAANAAAFLSPPHAVEDACDELLAHELGLMAGMRAAVIGAIRRFDPEVVEQKAGKIGGLMQLNRKARLWESYVEQYGKLQHDMADNLDRLFEHDFLRAYMEQAGCVKNRSRRQ